MSQAEFADQLKALGFAVAEIGGSRVSFPFTIPVGKLRGKEVTLGFEVPGDYPNTPPGGPHIRPRLLPLNPGAAGHPERVAESGFGGDWEYLSRPFSGWAESPHNAKVYMSHVRGLFATL